MLGCDAEITLKATVELSGWYGSNFKVVIASYKLAAVLCTSCTQHTPVYVLVLRPCHLPVSCHRHMPTDGNSVHLPRTAFVAAAVA